jgi:hypothetical protein
MTVPLYSPLILERWSLPCHILVQDTEKFYVENEAYILYITLLSLQKEDKEKW